MKEKFESVINAARPVLVDFYADWCAPCKEMEPVLKKVKGDLQDSIRVIKVNVDRNPELAALYKIRSIPTIMLFQQGEVIWSGVGVKHPLEILNVIRQLQLTYLSRSQAS